MKNPKTLARIAGVLYLALAVLGAWAQLAVRGSIYVAGDASATAANIVEHEALMRWALAADIVMATIFVVLGLTLQRLLYSSNARLATAMFVFTSVGAGTILLNLVFHVGALIVATQPAYAQNAEVLSLLMLDLHDNGYILGGIFFGLWLIPLGMIAHRSALFHRGVGGVLIIGGIAWLFSPILEFIAPGELTLVAEIVSIPTSIAEFGFILYLLIVGVRTPKGAAQSPARREAEPAATA